MKRSFRTSTLPLALILLSYATTCANATGQRLAALPSPSLPTQAVGSAPPMPAWAAFCQRHPGECAVNSDEPSTIELTSRAWALIVTTNRAVNKEIKPITDHEHWGVEDRWDLAPDGSGDCEDYQLLKRRRLVQQGLPARALRMTVAVDEEQQGHAVLMVRTNRGDFILDNKTNAVLPWRETGYRLVKRESENSAAWVALGGVPSPMMTANK